MSIGISFVSESGDCHVDPLHKPQLSPRNDVKSLHFELSIEISHNEKYF